jgi:NAD(P)-dependent dehydrogenase (short-subunit alcohol dehydrogenase family)
MLYDLLLVLGSGFFSVLIVTLVLLFVGARHPTFKNDLKKKKQAIFVTGAASGIGRATCERLIKEGSFVFAVDIAETALNNVYGSLDNKNVKALKLDVTNPEEVIKVADTVRTELIKGKKEGYLADDGLFGIVNCAGMLYNTLTPLHEKDEQEMYRLFNVNVFGVIRVVNAFYPLLVPNGAIINIASVASWNGQPFNSYYSTTKYAVRGYTDTLRRELMGRARVIAVHPGGTKTGMITTHPEMPSEGIYMTMIYGAMGILGKICSSLQEPDEVAKVICAAIFSSNSPIHVFADTFSNRLKYCLMNAVGPAIMDILYRKAYEATAKLGQAKLNALNAEHKKTEKNK